MKIKVNTIWNRIRARLTTPLALVGLMLLYPNDAYAYIEPGTRSVIIQVLVGVFLALGITSKKWWPPFKRLVSRLLGKENGQNGGE